MQIAGKSNQNSSEVLITSIHDVHLGTVEVVTKILKDLQNIGVPRVSLLVVPDFHKRGKVTQPEFCQWMSRQEAIGHEIVLHGYFHLRPPQKRQGMLGRMMTQFYTAGEGEFYDLGYESARQRLNQGKQMLAAWGVDGFIAPAWLLGAEAQRAAAEAGFRYTVRLRSIVDLQNNIVHVAPTLVYSTRSAWRREVSLLWNPLLKQFTHKSPLLRVSIHPPDWKYPRLRAQILRLATEALAARSPMTYHEWIRSS